MVGDVDEELRLLELLDVEFLRLALQKGLLGEGVRDCCTTMMARNTDSSFMRLAYSLMVFTPTFSSSGKKTKMESAGSSRRGNCMVRLARCGSSPCSSTKASRSRSSSF